MPVPCVRRFAQKRFACAVGSLDRIEVWGIRRQIAQGGASGLDRRLYTVDLVWPDIIHDDDVPALKGGVRALFDIAENGSSLIAPLTNIWRGQALASQCGLARNLRLPQHQSQRIHDTHARAFQRHVVPG